VLFVLADELLSNYIELSVIVLDLAQFFYTNWKINYEQFLEIIDCRLCRMEMGRWLPWRYCCFYYCVLATRLHTLLKLLKFFLTY